MNRASNDKTVAHLTKETSLYNVASDRPLRDEDENQR